jgi:hypothetical protein
MSDKESRKNGAPAIPDADDPNANGRQGKTRCSETLGYDSRAVC